MARLSASRSIAIGGKPSASSSANSTPDCASRKVATVSSASALRSPGIGLRLRHPREGRKFVDQPLQVLDLADDGVRAFVNQPRVAFGDARATGGAAVRPKAGLA